MLQFVIAGLVLGGIYAIAAAGLVITYTSSGILNFAFGAIAFFIARFYYYLHTQRELGHHPGRRALDLDRLARARRVPLRRPLPPPAALVAPDQGRRHHRPARRHPVARHADLRQPGHPAGPRARARARTRLPVPRGPGDPRPSHRLHLRRPHRRGRRRRAALHRGGPQGAGHGRLAGHDRPVRNQPHGDLRRRLGGRHVLRRVVRRARRARSSGSTPTTSRS